MSARYRRAVEGSGQIVEPDLKTPVSEILKRFKSNWNLQQTGKAYWIGYTDDMYSIAARGEKTIPQILDFAVNNDLMRAKMAAIYTIHLIGIECTIAGRCIEEFKNKIARQALYSLLDDEDVAVYVVRLLARDPWETDLPQLFQKLSGDNRELNKIIVNLLFRYPNDCNAFGGTLSEHSESPKVVLVTGEGKFELGTLTELTREKKEESVERVNRLIWSENDLIFQPGSKGHIVWKIKNGDSAQKKFAKHYPGLSLSRFVNDALNNSLRNSRSFRYCCDINDLFNFAITNNEIHLLTPEASRKIWLNWWNAKSKNPS